VLDPGPPEIESMQVQNPRTTGEAIVDVTSGASQPRCPACRSPLLSVGNREINISEAHFRGRQAYWCPAGCQGPEPDGTFELIECPACGSSTFATPRHDGVEELECHACGTITSLQIGPLGP
jgi:DNA-directed RNA polymerase subunit RPC12/RpoP